MTPTVLNTVETSPLTCGGTSAQTWMDNDVAYSYPSGPRHTQAVCEASSYFTTCGDNNLEPIPAKPQTSNCIVSTNSLSSSGGYATFNDFRGLFPYSDADFHMQDKPTPTIAGVPHYQPGGYHEGPAMDSRAGFSMLEHFAMTADQFPVSGTNCQSRIRTNLRKRERNLNINKAFEDLRGKIPNLPADTKVSKIKVLRLAADYIRHLNQVLEEANDTQDSVESSAEVSDTLFPSSPPQDGSRESRKRSLDEFKVDPEIVTIKRRKIDWTRIQEEIARHDNTSKSKRHVKQTCSYPQQSSIQNTFTHPCSSIHFPQYLTQQTLDNSQSQSFVFYPAANSSHQSHPSEVATHMVNDTSFSPASFSSWETE